MCGDHDHRDLKADRDRYVRETVLIGWQEDLDGSALELRNHTCGSTLCDGTTREADDTKEAA